MKNKVFAKINKTAFWGLFISTNLYLLIFFFVFNRCNFFPICADKPYSYAGPPGMSVMYPLGDERTAKFIFTIYAPMRKYLESKHIAVFVVNGKAKDQ